jgi:hypothetical protein
MPMQLPTDTPHLHLQTRQYEIFNRPLGQGIPRRNIGIGIAVCAVWFALMLLLQVSLASRFGPTLYIAPPFILIYLGTKTGEDGRMNLLLWYDALLARLPRRRRIIRNPLLVLGNYTPEPIRLSVTTELHPRRPGEPLVPLLGRRWLQRRATKR